MQNLEARSRAYARSLGVEIVALAGQDTGRWFTVSHEAWTILFLDSGTVSGPHCGDIVHRACKKILAARALEIQVERPEPPIPAARHAGEIPQQGC